MFNWQIWNFWYQNETLKIFCQNVKTLQDLCSSKCTKVHFNPKWEAFLEVQKHYWVYRNCISMKCSEILVLKRWKSAFFSDCTHRLRLECLNWIVLVLTSTCSNISTQVLGSYEDDFLELTICNLYVHILKNDSVNIVILY